MSNISKENLKRYHKAIKWIEKNTIDGHGIAVTSKQKVIYPEVTGYYIPTLIRWGHTDLAIRYADYLASIQKKDGSWYDPSDKSPYIFDSGQILKGLVAIYKIYPSVRDNIIKGCEWLISRMNEEGELVTPSKDAWGSDRYFCDEHIHLYCLEPLIKAGKLFERNDFIEAANKVKTYYISHYKDRILHFSMLSHFHAYVMEAMVDLGEIELAKKAMEDLDNYQKKDGSVAGLNNVQWVCSTGLFQLAITWYKLGDAERGNKAFEYACSLQNKSGGWYGSYCDIKFFSAISARKGFRKVFRKHAQSYFPYEEISWAVKYFLDALYFKYKCENNDKENLYESISINDLL